MPFLLPQVMKLDERYDGSKPLPHRLERLATLLAAGELTQQQVATACRTSLPTVTRLNRQPAFRARLAVLRAAVAKRAQEDEPLIEKGNRLALAGRLARTLHEQLEANDYTTTLGVSKQGNPIVGFDRARVSEIRQYLALIADELEGKRSGSTIVEGQGQQQPGMTLTVEQVVTRIQAVASRMQPAAQPAIEERAHAHAHEGASTPGMPRGVEGGMNGNEYDGKVAGGSPQGAQHIFDAKGEGSPQGVQQTSEAKEILEAEYEVEE